MEQDNKIVLVVDDDSGIRYLLSIRLISAGYMVYEAANGWEALEQMGNHSVDVVVTDYHMPEMNGFGFLSLCHAKWPGTRNIGRCAMPAVRSVTQPTICSWARGSEPKFMRQLS